MESFTFSAVLSAEHVTDVFFWLTAFIGSYFMLAKMKKQDGFLGSASMIYINRAVRLLPLYVFSIFFFWKFLVLFGGDGPLFHQYQTSTECSKHWFWHVVFLNNVVPWSQQNTCLPWTWYIANDF
jgi:peptidoglycan/LPS O-acetylase OafA/YrhL